MERALSKFGATLGRDALLRSRIVLSCRPKDWSETTDRDAVTRTIFLPPLTALEQSSGEDKFVATLARKRTNRSNVKSEENKDDLKVVILLPLDRNRTKLFAEARGLSDIKGFMDEVVRRNADEFVKRPMDLITITDMWEKHRKLGLRREQLELNISSSLTEGEETRHQNEALSLTRAREGVERIAWVMALAKRSTIHADAPSVARSTSPSVLSAEAVLDDWSSVDRARLLRLPIFDLAAIGQVRFHHRSIKDYLAAGRLHGLSQKNMSTRELYRLFISKKFGESVTIPSMREIAAWLALDEFHLRPSQDRKNLVRLLLVQLIQAFAE